MKRSLLIFILILSFFSINDVFAAGTCSLSSSGGALDIFLGDFFNQTSNWNSYLSNIAIKLYWFWFTAELLYQITFKKVLANDVNKLWYFIMIRTFTGYMFATIFVDPAFYTGIINYFVKIGSAAGGFAITPNSSNPFSSLSPSAVMDTGACIWDSAWKVVGEVKTGWWPTDNVKLAITVGLPIIAITLAVYILAAIMAFTLFMTALEAYIVMNAGVILCGFAGSSWTMGFWNKYLSYVGGVAIRLFVMCLILSVIQKLLINDLSGLSITAADQSIDALPALMGAMIKLLIDVLICTFLVVKVPAMAGSMLTGTVNSGLGDVISGASMVLAGAGLAAGLSKMGINLGGGGAGEATKDAFKDTLRGNGGGGLPSSTSSSGSSSGGERTASQTAQTATSSAEKAQGIADLSKDMKGTSSASKQDGQSANSSSSQSSSNTAQPSTQGSQATAKNSQSQNSSAQNNKQSQVDSTKSGNGGNSPNSPGAKPSDSSQSSTSVDGGNSGGGISGNDKSINNGGANSNTNNSSSNNDDGKKPSKAMQEMIKNKDSLIKNFDKMATNTHSGAAEININPHRE